jgi:phosphoketolase
MIAETIIKPAKSIGKECRQDAEQANMTQSLSEDELRKINAYWRAANYLSVGRIYLYDNPLLKEPLRMEHIKHNPGLCCLLHPVAEKVDQLADHIDADISYF